MRASRKLEQTIFRVSTWNKAQRREIIYERASALRRANEQRSSSRLVSLSTALGAIFLRASNRVASASVRANMAKHSSDLAAACCRSFSRLSCTRLCRPLLFCCTFVEFRCDVCWYIAHIAYRIVKKLEIILTKSQRTEEKMS